MSSQPFTVSLYQRTLRESQFIQNSIYGHFSSDSAQEFVLVKGSALHLVRITIAKAPTPHSITTICQHDTFSFIRDIKPFTFPDSPRCYIALATDTGTFSLLRYSNTINNFEIVVSYPYGRSGIRRQVPAQHISIDPLGRSVMLTSIERSSIAFGITSELIEPENGIGQAIRKIHIASGTECSTSKSSIIFHTTALYSQNAGDNPLFASIEERHANTYTSEQLQFHPDDILLPYTPKEHHRMLIIYEHDLQLGQYSRLSQIAQIPIPSTAHYLLPVPCKGQYPGGILVFCENCVFYYYIASTAHLAQLQADTPGQKTIIPLHGMRVDYPIRDTAEPSNIIINTATYYLLETKKTIACFVFLQTELGDILQLNLNTKAIDQSIEAVTTSGSLYQVDTIDLTYLDTLPAATSLHLTSKGQLFVTPEVGEACLYRLTTRNVKPQDISYAICSSEIYRDPEFLSQVYYAQNPHNAPFPDDRYIDTSITSILTNLPEQQKTQMCFSPLPLIRLVPLVAIPALGPLRASAVYEPALNPTLQQTGQQQQLTHANRLAATNQTSDMTVYTSVGSGPRSYITANKFGAMINVFAPQHFTERYTRIYPAVTNLWAAHHNILALVSNEATSFFSLHDDSFTNVQIDGLNSDTPSLAFGHVIDENDKVFPGEQLCCFVNGQVFLNSIALVQVTRTGVTALVNNTDMSVFDIHNPDTYHAILTKETSFNTAVSAAALNNRFIVIATSSTIQVLQLFNGVITSLCSEEIGSLVVGLALSTNPAVAMPNHVDGSLTLQSESPPLIAALGPNSLVVLKLVKVRGQYSLQQLWSQTLQTSLDKTLQHVNPDLHHGNVNNQLTFFQHDTYNPISRTLLTSYECQAISDDYLYSFQLDGNGMLLDDEAEDPGDVSGAAFMSNLRQSRRVFLGNDASQHMQLCPLFDFAAQQHVSQGSNTSPLLVLCGPRAAPQLRTSAGIMSQSASWSSISVIQTETATNFPVLRAVVSMRSSQGDMIFGLARDALFFAHPNVTVSTAQRLCSDPARFLRPELAETAGITLMEPNPTLGTARIAQQSSVVNSVPANSTSGMPNLITTCVAPVTYTPRGLHSYHVGQTALRFGVPLEPQIPKLRSAVVSARAAPSAQPAADASSGEQQETTTADDISPADVLRVGNRVLAKQFGHVLISVECDARNTERNAGSEYYDQLHAIQNETLDAHGIRDHYQVNLPEKSNVHELTGGNAWEALAGYIPGNEHQGCVRLLDPVTLETLHVVPTPPGMVVTSHVVTVLRNNSVIILGGYRVTPPAPTAEDDDAESAASANSNTSTLAALERQVTTGLLVAYDLFCLHTKNDLETGHNNDGETNSSSNGAISTHWAVELVHTTVTPFRVEALASLPHSRALLVGMLDKVYIYEMGLRHMLHKLSVSLQRGLIASISVDTEASVLDHTDLFYVNVYVGHHGQAFSMVRVGISSALLPTDVLKVSPFVAGQAPAAVAAMAGSAGSAQDAMRYSFAILCNSVDQRYVLSSTCVQGGILAGDRFGNIFLQALDQDSITSLIRRQPSSRPSTAVSGVLNDPRGQLFRYNEVGARLQCFADIHIGSPITSLHVLRQPQQLATPRLGLAQADTNTNSSTVNTNGANAAAAVAAAVAGSKSSTNSALEATTTNGNNISSFQQQTVVIYTTLDGRIGMLRPIAAPHEARILRDVTTFILNQQSLTGNVIRKYLGYFNPLLNIIPGDILIAWLNVCESYYFQRLSQYDVFATPDISQILSSTVQQSYTSAKNTAGAALSGVGLITSGQTQQQLQKRNDLAVQFSVCHLAATAEAYGISLQLLINVLRLIDTCTLH